MTGLLTGGSADISRLRSQVSHRSTYSAVTMPLRHVTDSRGGRRDGWTSRASSSCSTTRYLSEDRGGCLNDAVGMDDVL